MRVVGEMAKWMELAKAIGIINKINYYRHMKDNIWKA
jgi:hypothetical protein